MLGLKLLIFVHGVKSSKIDFIMLSLEQEVK
jgi:hypothetical protein